MSFDASIFLRTQPTLDDYASRLRSANPVLSVETEGTSLRSLVVVTEDKTLIVEVEEARQGRLMPKGFPWIISFSASPVNRGQLANILYLIYIAHLVYPGSILSLDYAGNTLVSASTDEIEEHLESSTKLVQKEIVSLRGMLGSERKSAQEKSIQAALNFRSDLVGRG